MLPSAAEPLVIARPDRRPDVGCSPKDAAYRKLWRTSPHPRSSHARYETGTRLGRHDRRTLRAAASRTGLLAWACRPTSLTSSDGIRHHRHWDRITGRVRPWALCHVASGFEAATSQAPLRRCAAVRGATMFLAVGMAADRATTPTLQFMPPGLAALTMPGQAPTPTSALEPRWDRPFGAKNQGDTW